ncbi:hypothetical protein ZIOFF_059453 [Zingiber officinale]|uniref:Uncharacterized protein n=1 Tax=Zingiber officinale TaxID=94328 RepID=A0A8J5FJY4_ZINOF|nr:hypothetical protein ZIOFF_059453 [Zingiber officinale]
MRRLLKRPKFNPHNSRSFWTRPTHSSFCDSRPHTLTSQWASPTPVFHGSSRQALGRHPRRPPPRLRPRPPTQAALLLPPHRGKRRIGIAQGRMDQRRWRRRPRGGNADAGHKEHYDKKTARVGIARERSDAAHFAGGIHYAQIPLFRYVLASDLGFPAVSALEGRRGIDSVGGGCRKRTGGKRRRRLGLLLHVLPSMAKLCRIM